MSTPQTEEYLEARRESCRLLGLNADDLTPHEMIRADLATVLRLWLDGSQSTLLAGGSADPVKLLSVVEALTKLLPEREQRSRGEDPRDYMWRTYSEMRRRGEIVNAVMEAKEVDRLRAENEQLKAQLAGAPPPGEPSATSPAPAAPGGNVVPLKPAAAAPAEEEYEEVVVTEAVPGQPEPWRSYVGGPDNSIISTPGKRWWGPVGS
jgi:hypothetical protein